MGGVPEVVLNSGRKMPVIGFGTACTQLPSPQVFVDAVETGYRHFDTAALYYTEKPLGEAIKEAIERGLVRSREELFITSKLWCTDADPDLVLPALRKSLENLQLEYLDLYLIHWPVRLKKGEIKPSFNKDQVLEMDIKSTWAAIEECQRLGLTRSIGVSNFSCKKLLELFECATIPPAVNQVEMNPTWHQRKLRKLCAEKGIQVCAWSPLGAKGTYWGSPAVMESPVLEEIAQAKGKSIAQISLRWLIEQGVSLIVKSFNKERMKLNLDVFDWELSQEESYKISLIPQKRGFSGDWFVSADGPIKSFVELWDGEI